VVVGGAGAGAAELGRGVTGLRLQGLGLGVGEEVVVAAEAGAGELLLVLLAHLADLGEVHGVVRQRAVLRVPVPERRHRHPDAAVGARGIVAPLLHARTDARHAACETRLAAGTRTRCLASRASWAPRERKQEKVQGGRDR
jgi:hypothetical protein